MNGDKEKPAGPKMSGTGQLAKSKGHGPWAGKAELAGLPDGQQGEREAVCGQ